MASPSELANEVLALSEPERTATVTKLFELAQAAITVRSATLDKTFVSMRGDEDCGTKFDRLMKELFGMTWKPAEPKKRRTSR